MASQMLPCVWGVDMDILLIALLIFWVARVKMGRNSTADMLKPLPKSGGER